jgi:hypothetical protein
MLKHARNCGLVSQHTKHKEKVKSGHPLPWFVMGHDVKVGMTQEKDEARCRR